MTEIEKKIRHINYLNKRITRITVTVHEKLNDINRAHTRLMGEYHELIELYKQNEED